MPTNIQWGWVLGIQNKLDQLRDFLVKEREDDAVEISQRFIAELKQRQPVGENDPFAAAFPDQNREPRPSIRQGLIPIEDGWRMNVHRGERGPSIVVSSDSEHLKYFTTWTGKRSYLGTRKRNPQVAHNAKTLAFWWNGAGHWPVSARGGGFTPESDFVQDAYDAIKPEISFSGRRLLTRARWFLTGE